MRISSIFLSVLLLFFTSGCYEVESNSNISIESDIPNMNIASTATSTPTIINEPSVESVPTVIAEPSVSTAENTEDYFDVSEPYPTDYDLFKEAVYTEKNLKRAYKSVYGKEPESLSMCGKFAWNNKPCELIYIEYVDTGNFNVFFLLVDENEDILYVSSPIINDSDTFVFMHEIAYLDVDGNGYEDFIIIYGFRTGAGSSHRNPPNLKVAVLFGDKDDFYRDYDLEFEVNYERKITSMDELDHEYDMDTIIGYLQSKFQ